MEKLLNLRVAVLVIAAVLAAFGVRNAFVAIFSKGSYEVIYAFDETARFCSRSHCVYGADLSVANTGSRMQDSVEITIRGMPPGIRGTPSILNLSAAEPRQGDPAIVQTFEGQSARIRITGLSPGTLVLVKFWGTFTEADQPGQKSAEVEIRARGRTIEGDPRAITLGRYLTSAPHGGGPLERSAPNPIF